MKLRLKNIFKEEIVIKQENPQKKLWIENANLKKTKETKRKKMAK